MKKILITGAAGQIGTELTTYLQSIYGDDQVIASGRHEELHFNAIYEKLDVLNAGQLVEVIRRHRVDSVIHLAAILSAKGESDPEALWQINMNGLYNVLEAAKATSVSVFTPSSIAAFGPETPLDRTPQVTIQRPRTIYGISKVAGELLCDYYYHHFDVDTRGVRFPGLISHEALPGGGTTDYAVHIFYKAIETGGFICDLEPKTFLDMMYMPDALRAIVELMEASPTKLAHRNAYNITAMSFSPEILAKEIQKHLPNFKMAYDINPVKQAIADAWPNSLDDGCARTDWGWKPEYDLPAMTTHMLKVLGAKLRPASTP
ncbi:NAD-dependent epimerase/dehydratase family protein [Acidaminobacter hydrogenoformans]|uniref:Nucleoside-diphosphate-sugar epimerase n=1 Tax=Acidaminobacter hydrogenoformans DSM 2784 TaxID=1120920 RepID=A0A1G5RT53_9FIRM|nr:NAD-dependent epimerase/dehydratase family protein [Acidaminobacter hydrogenoformans]SCZ77264.1 Nucleoside-diphosphate-sugar epimerase [Acidaminobacter hydrogenoformans DSM 2784]